MCQLDVLFVATLLEMEDGQFSRMTIGANKALPSKVVQSSHLKCKPKLNKVTLFIRTNKDTHDSRWVVFFLFNKKVFNFKKSQNS